MIAVLFARTDSVYKTMPECDVYDIERDARTWTGSMPVVAHPPCRGWGRLAQFSHATDDERMLAVEAVEAVRAWGGVLEHPAESKLWARCGLPRPGQFPDADFGYSIEIRQCDWGHRAEKLTWLYIVGTHVDSLPAFPARGTPTGVIKPQRGIPRGLPIVTKREREATPPALARWLVELAARCAVNAGASS